VPIYRSLIGLALAIFQVLQGAVPLPTEDQRFDLFGSYLEALRTQASIPGLSAAVVGENDIVWERAFGLQDIERSLVTRTDTPFHLDGLTLVFTSAMLLRCVEDGRLSLDDRIADFDAKSTDPNSTVRQILTHTSGSSNNLTFAYRPAALASLSSVVENCSGQSFRAAIADLLDRLAMFDSMPGPDALDLAPLSDDVDAASAERYRGVLARLATPYTVNKSGRATPSRSSVTTLAPAAGLISTVRDFARFDVALRKGAVLLPDTLAAAWQAPVDRIGQPLPHGLGWFVQFYKGQRIVWQFGVSENAFSSLVMTVPARDFSVILLANSDGLVKPFALADGDLTASPFGRLLLGTFVR
jgi:CubicO group peptidase (beta-lactamase class C family)